MAPLRAPPAPSFFDTSAISVGAFAVDAAVRRRIIGMPFGAAAARLGALHFESRTHFSFSRPQGRSYEQSDSASVHFDSAGNVHAVSATPQAQVELLTAGDRVFVRYDLGPLRQKTRRDVDVDELPEKAFAGIGQVLALFGPIAFVDARPDTLGERQVTRYRLQLGNNEALQAPAAAPGLGVRLPAAPPGRWREQARALDLAGTLAIDQETGVLLEAVVDGRLEIRDPQVKTTSLVVHHSHAVSQVGSAGNVRPPLRAIPEYRRAIRPRDPLAFFRDNLGAAPNQAPTEPEAAGQESPDAFDRPSAPPPEAQD